MASEHPSATTRRRPLSPHLQVYRPQITSVLSILHRITGVALAFGTILLVVWIALVANGDPFAYHEFTWHLARFWGAIPLFLWSFALFYHLANGIRHLFWDAGYGFEIKDAYRSGWIVVAVSAIATAVSWIVGLRLV